MLGGTCCVPKACLRMEKTTTNLKKLVIQLKTNGNNENTVININICKTGFKSLKIVSILSPYISASFLASSFITGFFLMLFMSKYFPFFDELTFSKALSNDFWASENSVLNVGKISFTVS